MLDVLIPLALFAPLAVLAAFGTGAGREWIDITGEQVDKDFAERHEVAGKEGTVQSQRMRAKALPLNAEHLAALARSGDSRLRQVFEDMVRVMRGGTE